SDTELVPVKITICTEAVHTREVMKSKLAITKEEVLNAKYPDPMYYKEVYQETME
ncbi:hypothetical protein KI387_010004, partial [Taxus chinensis]